MAELKGKSDRSIFRGMKYIQGLVSVLFNVMGRKHLRKYSRYVIGVEMAELKAQF